MPTEFDIQNMQIWTADGEPVNLGNFSDVQMFDDTMENDVDAKYKEWAAFKPCEMTFKCTFTHNTKRTLDRLAYGWSVSGPIRKRLLRRLFKMRKIVYICD